MAIKVGVTVTRDATADILRAVKALVKRETLVGIPADNASREPDEDEKVPLNNAEIGYLMENGVPEKNIPARPFLNPGIANAKDKIVQAMEAGAKKALSGDSEAADRTLNTVGIIGMNAVQAKITDGPFEPLSEVTLAKRRAKGRTGNKPLLDTGALRRSISYAVRPKGEKS